MRNILTIIFGLFPSVLLASVDYGWPGEGVPILSFIEKEQTACSKPKDGADCKEIEVNTEELFNLDNKEQIVTSLYFPIETVHMSVNSDFKMVAAEREVLVKQDELLEKYKPLDEGWHLIKYAEEYSSVYIWTYREYLSNWDEEPKMQWWLNIKNLGWIKINNNIKFHERRL